jgi:hypothetical protein
MHSEALDAVVREKLGATWTRLTPRGIVISELHDLAGMIEAVSELAAQWCFDEYGGVQAEELQDAITKVSADIQLLDSAAGVSVRLPELKAVAG